MANKKLPLIVIVGPTASGKSTLAVRLAKKFNGEVISADSRQVYRGLDIGTGKISRRERRGIPHHLLDVANPRRQFSVAEFQRREGKAIREITGRGKIPILVGGTMFWVDAVAYGLELPAVPPNLVLRRRLAAKSPPTLYQILRRIDPERARTIERQNPRRLIRAIEVARALGRTPKVRRQMPYRLLWLGVSLPPKTLRRRIHKRLLKRLRQGMVAEARRLQVDGLSWKRFYELGLEYRFLADYLQRKITKQQLITGLGRDIWRYSRRQLAWWRKNKSIRWLTRPADAEHYVRGFISGKNPRARRATTG